MSLLSCWGWEKDRATQPDKSGLEKGIKRLREKSLRGPWSQSGATDVRTMHKPANPLSSLGTLSQHPKGPAAPKTTTASVAYPFLARTYHPEEVEAVDNEMPVTVRAAGWAEHETPSAKPRPVCGNQCLGPKWPAGPVWSQGWRGRTQGREGYSLQRVSNCLVLGRICPLKINEKPKELLFL